MKTASFFTFEGPGRVSIARFPPRRTPAGFRVASELAPGDWFKRVARAEYERRFSAQLAQLDPDATVRRLVELAAPHEPVLLCWEEPPFTEDNWCHRRLVADWLERHLDWTIPEFEPPAWKARRRSRPGRPLAGDFATLDDGDAVYLAPLEPWMSDAYMARDFAGTHEYELAGAETVEAKLRLTRAGAVSASGVVRFAAGGRWGYEPRLLDAP